MSELIDELGAYWDVVTDLVLFSHNYCYNCQPRDEGKIFWISPRYDIEDAVSEVIQGVCAVNRIRLQTDINQDTIGEAIDEANMHCPYCGTEWESRIEIGGELVFDEVEDGTTAVHLLTRRHWPFLTHYTKSATGHSARRILDTILEERVLRASSLLVAGGYRVVCLTECSPPEIIEMMKLHVALAPTEPDAIRWRRAAYGIALDRSAAIREGALPVIHGDDELRAALPPSKRHLFVRFDYNGGYSDWTFEREFRFHGDLSLDRFGSNELLIVVPTLQERFRMLARLNVPPWPILALDRLFTRDSPLPGLTARQRNAWARTSP